MHRKIVQQIISSLKILFGVYYYYCYYYYYYYYYYHFLLLLLLLLLLLFLLILVSTICLGPVFLGPCSSSPLRGPRNLRGSFAGYELFPVVLLFEVDLVRSCQALRFSDVLRDLWVLLPGLRSPPAILFSKSFYFDFQV